MAEHKYKPGDKVRITRLIKGFDDELYAKVGDVLTLKKKMPATDNRRADWADWMVEEKDHPWGWSESQFELVESRWPAWVLARQEAWADYYRSVYCLQEYIPQEYINKLWGGAMSSLRSIPRKLKRVLNKNYRAFYQLGWVEDECLNITSKGSNELEEFLLDKFEDEFGSLAQKRVKELKKKEGGDK